MDSDAGLLNAFLSDERRCLETHGNAERMDCADMRFDNCGWNLFGVMYSVLYNGIPGKNINKGLNYRVIFLLVGTVPGMAITYLMMAVPTPIVASWLFGGLILKVS